MNGVADPLVARASAATLERVTFGLLVACIAALQLSIAAAHVLFAAAAVAWAAAVARGSVRPAAPAFFVPLAVYGLLTLVSAAFSLDPMTSLVDSRQLLLFALVPIVFTVVTRDRAGLVVMVIITVGAASAAVGIFQYALLHYDSLGRRPDGALTHYMTYSGTLMLAIAATAARLVLGGGSRTWPALVMPALVVALGLTLTRSAWIGASVAVALLFVLRDFRLLALLPIALALFFAVAPDTVTSRMLSIVDIRDPSNRDRLAMLQSGAAMVSDDPLTGVGPDMIPGIYERYRVPDAVNETTAHLHNVPLQIAAERGLPALAAWLWFVGACSVGLWRLYRADRVREPGLGTGVAHPDPGSVSLVLAALGLAAVAAMLSAGLFEYNFGDSEFLMLFLVLVTLPFAAARPPARVRLQ